MGWLILVIAIFILYMVINSSGSNIKNKIRTKDGYPKIDLTIVQCGNAPQGIEAILSCSKDKIIVNTNGFTKTIPNEDIIDITLENYNNITNSSQFSFGKAVAGMALFGGVGVVAGTQGKSKYKDLKMLVISYIENDDIGYMIFLQQYGKNRTVKAEAFLLDRVKDDILEVVNGTYDARQLETN